MTSPKWEAPTNLFSTHFKALFTKRVQYAKRDKQAVCCNTITPSIVFMIGLIILKTSNITEDPPPYALSSATGGDEWRAYNKGGDTPIPYNTIYAGDAGAATALFASAEEAFPAGNAKPTPFDVGCGSAARSCAGTFEVRDGDRGAGPKGAYEFNAPNFAVVGVVDGGGGGGGGGAGGVPSPSSYEQSVYFKSVPYEVTDASWTDFNATTVHIGYQFFVTGFSASKQSQYGGFAIAAFFDGDGDGDGSVASSPQMEYTIVQNTTAAHSVATFQNYMSNLLSYRFNPDQPYIYAANYPLPNTVRIDSNLQSVNSFTAVLFLMIAYSFIPARCIFLSFFLTGIYFFLSFLPVYISFFLSYRYIFLSYRYIFLSFIPASIVQYVVREKESSRNAKV
jgi:hypothetical protein